MIKKFKNFLNEEIQFRYKSLFRDFLLGDNSDIAKVILNSDNRELNIAFTNLEIDKDSRDMLTFNPEDRSLKDTYLFSNHNTTWTINQLSFDPTYYRSFDVSSYIDGWIYPIKLPYDYKRPESNKMNLSLVIKFDGTNFEVVDTKTPFDLKETYSIKYLIVLKDINNIHYFFEHRVFYRYFLKLDFKENRNEKASIGRLINKLLQATSFKFEPRELEEFVNRYKAYKKILDGDALMDVVSGDDIRKWYDESNYSNGVGSLNKSCMRFEECQEYFSIYTENPEVCQMVILYNGDKTKIEGRALLWTLTDGKKVMDRIYTTSDSFTNIFKKWATENGYIQREITGGTIQLKKMEYSPFPYLDTFCYYNINLKTLSTNSSPGTVILNDTEGDYIRCEYCDGSGQISCEECGGDGERPCPECDGVGSTEDDDGNNVNCSECNGTGNLECLECMGNGTIDCPECS